MENKKIRRYLPLIVAITLLVVSTLACRRDASPDVEPTAAATAGAQDAEEPPADGGMPDLDATARAESTRVAESPGETQETAEPPADATPTSSPPETTEEPPATETPSTTAVPTFTPNPATATLEPTVAGQVEYTVKPGDNLFRIALNHNTTADAVASANGIANPAMIYVGQVLTISSSGSVQPPATGGTTHTVQAGDNLFRIALKYNMSYVYLAQYNNIANPASIYVGQVIRIP